MKTTFLAEDFRKISDQLNNIIEAADPTVDDDDEDDETGTIDNTITDLMTKEKTPEKLTGTMSVKSLAADLGLENINAFQSAFNSLRQGKMPNNATQVRELAIAFDKLLAADASTTSRVLTNLRRIHKNTDVVSEEAEEVVEPAKPEAGNKQGITKIYKGEEGWVYSPTTKEGAIYLTKNTKSTMANNMFEKHSELGPIYVVFNKEDGERFIVQPAAHMATDSDDNRIDMDRLPAWATSHIK